jgi:hypothetical protein
MKKDVVVSFRTSAEMRQELKRLAEEGGESLSNVIENIVTDGLKKRFSCENAKTDRRKHPRKGAELPVFLNRADSEERTFYKGAIRNVSLSGVRISLPKEVKEKLLKQQDLSHLEMHFALPEDGRPVSFTCRGCWANDDLDEIQLGACFIDGDFRSCQGLQDFLSDTDM